MTKFVVRDGAGAAVTKLCPGETYSVAVAFPQPRLSLTTVGTGAVRPQTGRPADSACPNRLVVDKTQVAALHSFTWEVPCFPSSERGGTGVVVVGPGRQAA
jgi:hypothetical protein